MKGFISFFLRNSSFNIRYSIFSFLVALFLIFLSGCQEKPKQGPPPPPAVTVAQPVKRAVTDYLELTGNTQAVKTVQLVARVAGYLEKVFFQDGQSVKRGDLLFLIQQNTYQDNLQQAEAAILLQKAQLEYAETNWTATPICCSRRPPPKPMSTTGGISGIRPRPTCTAAGAAGPGQTQPGLHRGQGSFRRPDRPQAGGPGESRGLRREHGPGPVQPNRSRSMSISPSATRIWPV